MKTIIINHFENNIIKQNGTKLHVPQGCGVANHLEINNNNNNKN